MKGINTRSIARTEALVITTSLEISDFEEDEVPKVKAATKRS